MVNQSQRSIDCNSFENRIQDLMDCRIALSSDASLARHAASCDNCKEVLANFQFLETALGSVFAKVSEDRKDSVALIPPKEIPQWSLPVAIVALAAVLALVIIPNFTPASKPIEVAKNTPALETNTSPPARALPTQSRSVVEAYKLPGSPRINLVSYDLPPTLRNAYQYAAELPGIRPMECSLNVTLEAIQSSFNNSTDSEVEPGDSPDLGLLLAEDIRGLS